jgi:hypothetical protein
MIVVLTTDEIRWLGGLLRGWCSDEIYTLEGQPLVDRFKRLLELEMERPTHTSTDPHERGLAEFVDVFMADREQAEKKNDPDDPFYTETTLMDAVGDTEIY